MKNIIIELKSANIRDTFKDFSISFVKNNITSISGPNNCGKTTLMRTLAGILNIDSTFFDKKKYSSYSIKELNKNIQCIIPDEIAFVYDTVESNLDNKLNNDELLKKLKLNKLKAKKIDKLEFSELIKLKLFICLINKPKILLLDDIYKYLTSEDSNIVKKVLKDYQNNYDLTIIQTISNLNDSLESDYLYIINNSKIVLEGRPLEILQNDNVINKIGLELPFLMDLSVKLRDYEVVSRIITNEKELVEEIWKEESK